MNDETPTATAAPKLEDLKRDYFAPGREEQAAIAIEKARAICAAHNLPVAFNWKAEDGETLPDGYGVSVLPITQRREGSGNVAVGLYIAGIPSVALIQSTDGGQLWVNDVCESALLNKFANTVRPRDGQETPLSVPYSVADFITRADRDQGLAFYRSIQADYVGALNKLFKRKIMNGTLLRQVLQSAAFANQQFAKLPQATWEKMLQKMISQAEMAGENAGIIQNWLDTRAEAQIEIADDWDMDDLNTMLGEDATAE